MKVVLGSVLIGLLGALTACGGSSSGGGGSTSDPIVKGPQEQDCGESISLAKTYTLPTPSKATSLRTDDTSSYRWSNPTVLLQEEYGTSNPSGTINVTNGELIDACMWVQQSFAGIGPETWDAEDNYVFPKNGDDVYFTPNLYLEFNLPQYLTYDAWDEAGQPESEDGVLKSARLTIDLAKYARGGFVGFFSDPDTFEQTPELELSCEEPFKLKYSISHYSAQSDQDRAALSSLSPDVCHSYLVNGSTMNDCLSVSLGLETNSCTFTSEKIFVPDNTGEFYQAAVSGSLTDNGVGKHRITITEVDILSVGN